MFTNCYFMLWKSNSQMHTCLSERKGAWMIQTQEKHELAELLSFPSGVDTLHSRFR